MMPLVSPWQSVDNSDGAAAAHWAGHNLTPSHSEIPRDI